MPSTRRRHTLLIRLAVGMAFTALGLGTGWLVVDSLRMAVSMPAQLNYLDGYIVDDGIRVAAGEQLYEDPSVAPYAINMYTPCSMITIAGLIQLGMDGFTAGRLLSFLSLIGIACVIAVSGVRRTGWIAPFVALAYFLNSIHWPWSLVVRPDLPALLLSIIAIVLVATNDRRYWLPAALLLAAALMTKQSSIAAPAAACCYLLVKRWPRGFAFGAVYASTVAVAVLFVQWWSHGFFLFHVAVANDHPFSWLRAWIMYRRFVESNPLESMLLVGLLLTTILARRWSMPAIYAFTAAGVSMAVGRTGASMNHFLELVAAIALLVAWEFPVGWFDRRKPARIAIASLLVTAFVLVSAASWVSRVRAHRVARAMLPVHGQLVKTVASVDGPVVSDDATAVVGAGKRVHIRPFIMTQLSHTGRWDQEPFLDELRRKEVGMIIVRTEPPSVFESRYTPAMRRHIEDNYRVAFTYVLGAPFTVFVPNTPDNDHPAGG